MLKVQSQFNIPNNSSGLLNVSTPSGVVYPKSYTKRAKELEEDTFEYSSNPMREKLDKNPKNIYVQGHENATRMHTILSKKVGAVSTPEFSEELCAVNKHNVIPTLKAYKKLSPNESLVMAICNERGAHSEVRKVAVKNLLGDLVQRGEDIGVNTEHYKSHFEKELDIQFNKWLPVKSTKLDKTMSALVHAILNKKKLTSAEKAAIKESKGKDLEDYTIKLLSSKTQSTEKSFNYGMNYDGWCAKLADNVSVLWGSDNRAKFVKSDIKSFKAQVNELQKASKKGSGAYEAKFKEIFNISYDPELIVAYKNKEDEFRAAVICAGIEQTFNKNLSDLVNKKPLQDTYFLPTGGMHPVAILSNTKKEMFDKNYDAFAEFLGNGDIENGKKQMETKFKDYRITEKSTMDDKYEVMQRMANRYSRRLNQDTKNITKGVDLKELRHEYRSSYYAAFGVENDIAQRVSDYNNSQLAGAYAVQGVTIGIASVLLGIATVGVVPTLKAAGLTSGFSAGIYLSDRMTSKEGLKKEDLEEILKAAALDGATMIASSIASKGISHFTSAAFKANNAASKLTEIAMMTAADLGIDSSAEYLLTGKVTIQGMLFSVVFSTGGQLLEMKLLKGADLDSTKPSKNNKTGSTKNID